MDQIYITIADKISRLVEENNVQTICDYGCGRGDLLTLLHSEKPGLQLTGIDYFSKSYPDLPETMQDSAIKLIDRENLDFAQLPKFDLVVSTSALHHFQYPISELQRILGLVKPGKLLYLNDNSYKNNNRSQICKNITSFIDEMVSAHKSGYHRHQYTLQEALDLCKALPAEVIYTEEFVIAETESEKQENKKEVIARTKNIIATLTEKAPEFAKMIWLPFYRQQLALQEEYGTDFTEQFSICLKK